VPVEATTCPRRYSFAARRKGIGAVDQIPALLVGASRHLSGPRFLRGRCFAATLNLNQTSG